MTTLHLTHREAADLLACQEEAHHHQHSALPCRLDSQPVVPGRRGREDKHHSSLGQKSPSNADESHRDPNQPMARSHTW